MTPLRRVRRVLRWIETCGLMIPECHAVHTDFSVHGYERKNEELLYARCEIADELFAAEIEFCATLAGETISKRAELEIINDRLNRALVHIEKLERALFRQQRANNSRTPSFSIAVNARRRAVRKFLAELKDAAGAL